MEFLQRKGICFGEGGIIRTTSKHGYTYYLTESSECISLLSEYRRNCIT